MYRFNGIPGSEVAVLFICLTKGETQLAQQTVLDMRNIDDYCSFGFQDPEQFLNELEIVRYMFKKVYDDHAIELLIAERRACPVHLIDLTPH